jgi:hypothetical protein
MSTSKPSPLQNALTASGVYGFTIQRSSRPPLRRLSSLTATKEQVSEGGPVVVVPPRLMGKQPRKFSRGFAASLEQARTELSTVNLEEDPTASPAILTPAIAISPPSSEGVTPDETPSEDTFAFAFDIDGVLVRGGNPIPEAIEAMKYLNGDNEYGVKVYVSCSCSTFIRH